MSNLETIKAGLEDLLGTDDLTYDLFHESHREMLADCKDDDIIKLLTNCLLLVRPAIFVSSIENTINAIDEKLELTEEPAVLFADKQIADAKDMKSQLAVSERRILKQISRIGKSCMIMGAELKKAKELLKKQAPFLEWTKEKFGMGKSQAYALISAYEEFGANPAMQLLPARVLRIVGGIKEATVKAQVIAELTEEVKVKGTVSIKETEDILTETEILNHKELTGPKAGRETPVARKLDSDGTSSELKKVEAASNAINKAYKTLNDVEGGTVENEEGIEDNLVIESPVEETKETLKVANEMLKAAMAEMKLELENIKAKLVPYLAQFNNPTAAGKLGIAEGCVTSVAVMAHERLTQVWTKESSPNAWALLNAALAEFKPLPKAV